jgi:hypothetical protein
MRTGSGTNESWIGGYATSGENRLHSWGGGSGYVSGNTSNAEEQVGGTASGQCNYGNFTIQPKTWFDSVENTGCIDGVCPVPWATPSLQEDVVNHPSHYTDGGIECIDALEAQLTTEEYRGYLKGNIAKYVWRERHKGKTESLKKALFYLNRLILLDENM